MTDREQKRPLSLGVLIAAILFPLFIGGVSAFMTAADMQVYETMNKPPLSPPGWLFPLVWTALYVLMGVASYLVYSAEADPDRKKKALLLYFGQLIMNFYWPVLFFSFSLYLISFIWLAVMWVLVLLCTVRFFRIRPLAGLLMAALLIWCTFAAYLK